MSIKNFKNINTLCKEYERLEKLKKVIHDSIIAMNDIKLYVGTGYYNLNDNEIDALLKNIEVQQINQADNFKTLVGEK